GGAQTLEVPGLAVGVAVRESQVVRDVAVPVGPVGRPVRVLPGRVVRAVDEDGHADSVAQALAGRAAGAGLSAGRGDPEVGAPRVPAVERGTQAEEDAHGVAVGPDAPHVRMGADLVLDGPGHGACPGLGRVPGRVRVRRAGGRRYGTEVAG